MSARRGRGGAVLAAAVVAVLLVAAPAVAPSAPNRFLTGQLLVATEALEDARFARSVVFLARHDADGAQGIMINRPVTNVPIRDLLRRFGLDPRQAADVQVRVHYGGPIQRQRALVLHTPDYTTEGTTRAGALALTTDPGILSAMAAGTGPRRTLFAVGHAGWAPGQLEREIEEGYWFTAPADDALVFDTDHVTKWERATARRRINL